jgi:SsrA-binding protein
LSQKILIKNKRAYFDYEIIQKYEAGISLLGAEVKAIRSGQASINEAYVKPIDGGLFLWNATIERYKYSNDESYDPNRSRRLLLHKREIADLAMQVEAQRLTIVPLSIYLTHGKIKLELALAKGKKSHDKQRRIKERDLDRDLHREKRKYMVK